MFYFAIWYEGHNEKRSPVYETAEEAAAFMADTGLDPDEFDIVESETDPILD
jgi:hypothetical protein